MAILSVFKSTVFCLVLLVFSCKGQTNGAEQTIPFSPRSAPAPKIVVGANRTVEYLPMLMDKAVGVVANQTSVIFKKKGYAHLVDSLLCLKIDVKKVFTPEHGFRGEADAGEPVLDSLDKKTGLPLISLYGENKKPSKAQLDGLEIVLFDIQDVGVRFYTYIATLQLVMEACAENGIPILVLDRPNPNGHYVDGPTMQMEHSSFLGMAPVPLVYGMTIGEYAQMLNSEGWLKNGEKVDLTVIPLMHYTHRSNYSLPIRPSPNLPNDMAINLYPSLGLFEGTHINAGRGTEFQFQRFGASFLDSIHYSFRYVPQPNSGSKNPKEKGGKCFGRDLSNTRRMDSISLHWLIEAYNNSDRSKFFKTGSFTKHSGTDRLQRQIEAGATAPEIKATWLNDLENFEKIRKKHLLYE